MYIGAMWLDSRPSVIILSHPIRRLHSWYWYTQNPRLWVHLLAALGPLAESRRSKPNKGGLFCSNQRLSLQNEPGAEPGRSFAVGNMLPAGRPTQPARPRSEQCVGYRGWGATIVFLSLLHKKKKISPHEPASLSGCAFRRRRAATPRCVAPRLHRSPDLQARRG